MSQASTPVPHKIVKAKIKNRKWKITHERAQKTYKRRRKPKMEIEKNWPVEVRSLFCRLRSGHAVELKRYRHEFLHTEEDGLCSEGCGKVEDIQHVLCECKKTKDARTTLCPRGVKIHMMTTKPNMCRKILMTKFGKLRLPQDDDDDGNDDDDGDDDEDEDDDPPPQAPQPEEVSQ